MSALSDLMGVLLPGGVAAGGVMILQAIRSWREGRYSREETVLRRYQRLTNQAEQRADIAEQDEAFAIRLAYYWRMRAAALEHTARVAGIEIPPADPLPVKEERERVGSGTTRRKKAVRRPTGTSEQEELET